MTAADLSDEALALARENAEALGLISRVRLVRSDWYGGLESGMRFDLIAANPPYLSADDVAGATPEVREHEPRVALTPGSEGREALDLIIAGAPARLAPDGLLALETGIDQHATLQERAAAAGFTRAESRTDLNNRDRYLLAWCG